MPQVHLARGSDDAPARTSLWFPSLGLPPALCCLLSCRCLAVWGGLLAGLALMASGCGSSPTDVDVDDRAPLPSVAQLDFGAVEPAEAWDYWELRWMMPPGADSILGSGGAGARAQLPSQVQEELDALSPATGFAQGCLPGHCFKILAGVDGDEIHLWTTVDGLLEFLGSVDSLVEAALLLDAHGFWWDEGEDTGWRSAPGGWEFVVLERVSSCAPVQTDRVRLLVAGSGELHEQAREVWERLEGACI